LFSLQLLAFSRFWISAQKPPGGVHGLLGDSCIIDQVSRNFQKLPSGNQAPLGNAGSLCFFYVHVNGILDALMFYNCFMEFCCVIADVKLRNGYCLNLFGCLENCMGLMGCTGLGYNVSYDDYV